MAVHSSMLAWEIPSTEELCRLQSMGLRRVGHGVKQLRMHAPDIYPGKFTEWKSGKCFGVDNALLLLVSFSSSRRDIARGESQGDLTCEGQARAVLLWASRPWTHPAAFSCNRPCTLSPTNLTTSLHPAKMLQPCVWSRQTLEKWAGWKAEESVVSSRRSVTWPALKDSFLSPLCHAELISFL